MRAISGPAVLDCSVFGAVETIGDAWSWMVLSEAIVDGVSRFDDFQRRLRIARSTLSTRLTRRVLEASRILQLNLIDHVIIGSPAPGRSSYFSFKE